jgi:hypothetical protein
VPKTAGFLSGNAGTRNPTSPRRYRVASSVGHERHLYPSGRGNHPCRPQTGQTNSRRRRQHTDVVTEGKSAGAPKPHLAKQPQVLRRGSWRAFEHTPNEFVGRLVPVLFDIVQQ